MRDDEVELCPHCNARLSTVYVCSCTYKREGRVKAAASAMRAAAAETGVDFMTSPLSDIVKALERAAAIESQRAAVPCPDCGWSETTHVFDHDYYHGVRHG